MKRVFLLAVFVMGCVLKLSAQLDPYFGDNECTSIMVGRLASKDGSVITSHTCDGVSHTWVSIEPAATHKKGDTEKIYRGTRWTKFKGDTTGVKYVGEIPQAEKTYAYLNTGYPSMNEKQLGIGESTFVGPDTLVNKDALFMIEDLARIALQRCDNARDAIKLMGSLAEKYGYADTGECLTVADKNEVWMFEIVGCGKNKIGAVWAAKRVPDDHVAVSANIPRIGKMERKDKANFMASDNAEKVALEYGLWDGRGEFIFWKAFNASYAKGKNFLDREFFILNSLAPSLNLTYDMDELPFSVKPDEKVDVRKVMELFRSTYEGTPFDMCQNVLVETPDKEAPKSIYGKPATKKVISPVANPWLSTPMRNMLNTIAPETIEFRRTVAVAWCSYSTVIQLRNWLPDAVGGICWWGADNPGQSPRIPIFAGNTSLPEAFNFCGQKKYYPESVLWQFRRPNRLATVAWQENKQMVQENILKIEEEAFGGLEQLSKNATATELNAYTAKIYEAARDTWKEMEEKLWMKHGRGF